MKQMVLLIMLCVTLIGCAESAAIEGTIQKVEGNAQHGYTDIFFNDGRQIRFEGAPATTLEVGKRYRIRYLKYSPLNEDAHMGPKLESIEPL